MKNIWIINHYAIPPTMGGLNRHYYFSKYLSKKGYNVKIFTASKVHNTSINMIKDKSLYKETEIEDVNYTFVKTRNYGSNYIKRILNMFDFPINMVRVSKSFKRPDIIYTSSPNPLASLAAIFLAKKYGAKLIIEIRDLWPESFVAYNIIKRSNPILNFLYAGEKFIYKKADTLIFTMEGGKDYIIEKGWNKENGGPISVSKVSHINNGVDLELFNYNKEHFTIMDNDLNNDKYFKVVYAGSIRKVNNVKKIIDAAEYIKKTGNDNIKFLIYGDGNEKEQLERYCVENNIDNVIFKGFVEKNKVPYILSKCNLNIMHFEQNDIKKYGASLNKMFEYFASGRPTVSDCEFRYDLINRYKCGVVVDNANAEQLAEAIVSFFKMRDSEYNNYCENALIASQDFDFKSLTDKLEKIILND
ncbi:glycosyltransferase family 4 protein [Neobacillus niacini]|uniref:glycosyltransferase family 4 protein n=1 Tax=Neobacillus niacini TaxID=86668 RepID=UPI002FFEB52A